MLNFKKPFLFASLALSLTACGANTMSDIQKDNNPLGNKPYAEVAFNASGDCSYQILLNDIPIYADEGVMNATVPVNQYMINGQNNLAISIQQGGKHCNITANLKVRHEDPTSTSYLINTVSFKGDVDNATQADIGKSTPAQKLEWDHDDFSQSPDGYIVIQTPELEKGKVYYGYDYDTQKRQEMQGVKVSQNVTVPIDLPHWAWLDGEKIENNEQTKKELLAIYQQIWADIQDKKWNDLEKLFALRDKEMDQAFYLNGTNTVKSLKQESENKNNKLFTTDDFSDVFTNVFANQKLVTLTWWAGGSIFAFDKSEGGTIKYNIVLAKINGKYVIVR